MIQPDRTASQAGPLALIARLNAAITSALAPYQPGAPFALVDFPDHANVGDNAIWLGTLAHFRRSGRHPAYVCSKDSFDPAALAAAAPDGPIYITGGGNFGDLWPAHQNFRCDLLRRFFGRPIIQLPQTIHFADPANIAETRRAIAAHSSFVLLVRDHASQAFATANFDCPVLLCPDMAFCLGPLARPRPPSHRLLYLLRNDQESRSAVPPTIHSHMTEALVMDWPDEPPAISEALIGDLQAAFAAGLINSFPGLTRRLATIRLSRGIQTLALGRHVVTDRLHGHILCTLLGIPHTVLDNNYGKLSRFIETWSTNPNP
jgi:pyruvyl transferase EpsO